MPSPSQVPVRYPSGVSTDSPYQVLANYGNHNPFFYHLWADDFDGVNAIYTATKTGNGTIAAAAGDGGLALFTTNSSTPAGTDICSLQLPAASFSYTQGKKMFFLTRLQLSSATNAAFNVGLIQTTTTPFTVTDGIFFNKASGALNNLLLSSNVSSTATTVSVPTSYYTLANATNIDLGFYIDRNGNVYGFIGQPLVGFVSQGGAATQMVRGPMITLLNSAITNGITAVNLNPTVAIQSGTAASSTMTVDFMMAAKER